MILSYKWSYFNLIKKFCVYDVDILKFKRLAVVQKINQEKEDLKFY